MKARLNMVGKFEVSSRSMTIAPMIVTESHRYEDANASFDWCRADSPELLEGDILIPEDNGGGTLQMGVVQIWRKPKDGS